MAHSPNQPARRRRRCFTVSGRIDLASAATWQPMLADRPAEALAVLLPVLGCGEEAAALAFDDLAEHQSDAITASALGLIACEERVHDALIARLQAALPGAPRETPALIAARRFHVGLAQGGAPLHLARIAALDSAVCTVLSRLLRKTGPIAADPVVSLTLARIHRDEGRHVRLSRDLARERGPARAIGDAAAAAREALAGLLEFAADAFEDLGVDPSGLYRDLRRLPNRLLTT